MELGGLPPISVHRDVRQMGSGAVSNHRQVWQLTGNTSPPELLMSINVLWVFIHAGRQLPIIKKIKMIKYPSHWFQSIYLPLFNVK